MNFDKWSLMSDKEKKMLEHSVPWQHVLKELYKNYSRKEIFNLMESGELSFSVNLMDESRPHGLEALWLYGSDNLEGFLRDYNVFFYRDSLSDILRTRAKKNSTSKVDTETGKWSIRKRSEEDRSIMFKKEVDSSENKREIAEKRHREKQMAIERLSLLCAEVYEASGKVFGLKKFDALLFLDDILGNCPEKQALEIWRKVPENFKNPRGKFKKTEECKYDEIATGLIKKHRAIWQPKKLTT